MTLWPWMLGLCVVCYLLPQGWYKNPNLALLMAIQIVAMQFAKFGPPTYQVHIFLLVHSVVAAYGFLRLDITGAAFIFLSLIVYFISLLGFIGFDIRTTLGIVIFIIAMLVGWKGEPSGGLLSGNPYGDSVRRGAASVGLAKNKASD